MFGSESWVMISEEAGWCDTISLICRLVCLVLEKRAALWILLSVGYRFYSKMTELRYSDIDPDIDCDVLVVMRISKHTLLAMYKIFGCHQEIVRSIQLPFLVRVM
jgi:hypothetical protein